MTIIAETLIKDINKIKREIHSNEEKMDKTRNLQEYDKLTTKAMELHIELKRKAELLVKSVGVSLDLNVF